MMGRRDDESAVGYASPAFADPADIRSVYYTWGGALMRARVDYAAKQWTVDAVWNASLPEGVTRGLEDMRVLHANGRTYVYGEGHAHPLFIVDGYSLRQVAAAGKHSGYLQPQPKEWYDDTFTWFDANGNGKADGDELNVVKSPVGGRMNGLIGSYLTDKLVWYLPDFNRVLRLWPLEIDKAGAPRYLWSLKAGDVPGVDIPVKQLDPEIGGESTGCEADSKGNVYSIWNVGGQTRARSYWGARCSMNRVAKYSPEGTLIWEAGRHCSGDCIKPGEMYHIWKTAGLEDCINHKDSKSAKDTKKRKE